MKIPTNREELISLFREMETPEEFSETMTLIDDMDDDEIAEGCAMCAGFVTVERMRNKT